MSSGQQTSSQQSSSPTWTEPPWCGWIETTGDALLILEAARRGLIPRVTRRLVDSERKMITSGSVFVFDEDESGIKRWTDGFFWSPSRILGNFLLYRETDKRGAGHRSIKADQELNVETSSETTSLSRPKGDSASLAVDKHRERSLVGSLTNSYKFKPDGLMKKTFSVTIGGVAQHLISYYKIEDVESGRLRSPSSLPELASLDISPEYLDKTHFRNPPKVEIGADGIPRYRGEADDVDISPTSSSALSGTLSASNIPPLLSEGRVTDASSKRGKRYDPYGSPSMGKRTRKTNRSSPQDGSSHSGENGGSPIASTSSTLPSTVQSSPPTTYSESSGPMAMGMPVIGPSYQPYAMPPFYPPYPPPPPGHIYGPPPLAQTAAGVSMPPYPPPAISNPATTTPSAQYAAYPGYANPSTTTNNNASTTVTNPSTQVRVSDPSQAGLVPTNSSSSQPGPAPAAAAAAQALGGQAPYAQNHHPQYPYPYYGPPPAHLSAHGYAPPPPPPPPAPAGYPWPQYPAYGPPPPPPHPSAGHQPPVRPSVQPVAGSYTPQVQDQQQGNGEGDVDESENA